MKWTNPHARLSSKRDNRDLEGLRLAAPGFRNGVQMPGSFDAFELAAAALVESQSGSGDQVLDRLRDEDLRRFSEGGDASCNVHGDPGRLLPRSADFACVEAGANFELERPDRIHDRPRTLHAACGPVERCEEAVAGDVLLDTPIAPEHGTHDCVMAFDQLPPGAVADGRRLLSRADDVGKEHGREDALELGLLLADATQERLDRIEELILVARPYRPIVARELHESRAANPLGEVAAGLETLDRIALAMQDKCRRLNRRQYRANVEL